MPALARFLCMPYACGRSQAETKRKSLAWLVGYILLQSPLGDARHSSPPVTKTIQRHEFPHSAVSHEGLRRILAQVN